MMRKMTAFVQVQHGIKFYSSFDTDVTEMERKFICRCLFAHCVTSTVAGFIQGSHSFRLTKFHDISMIFPGFFSKFPGIFSLFLKYNFQVVLNINRQTY